MSTAVAAPPLGSLAPDEQALLRRLITQGFLLRAGLAVFLAMTGYSRMFAPDETTYFNGGRQIATYWDSDGLVTPYVLQRDMPKGYFYMNAASIWLFGQTELPLKLLNAFVGAFTCRYFFLLARSLFGKAVARRTAFFFAFFPSLILWSALNIRDVWVIFLIAFLSWTTFRLTREFSFNGVGVLIAALWVVTTFRDYLFVVVAVPPMVSLLLSGRGHLGRNAILASVAGIGVLALIQGGAGVDAAQHMSLEALAQTREDMAHGAASAFEQDVDISTPGRAIAFLPIGLAYFLFSPFPWQIASLLRMMTMPEMLVIYALTPAIFRGIKYVIQYRLREALQIVLLTLLLSVSYALGEGNVGTLYRHRAQAIGFYLMFAAVGLELKARKKQAQPQPAWAQPAPLRAPGRGSAPPASPVGHTAR